MDDFWFKSIVNQSTYSQEQTSYLEIYICDDIKKSFFKEGSFKTPNDFRDWLHPEGRSGFNAPLDELKVIGSFRLVIQQECDPESFEPGVITLPPSDYVEMIAKLKLTYRQLESTNSVGPFLWSVTCQNDEQEHLQLLYRSVKGMKAGHCQGWELLLTYLPQTHTTTGFFRGTKKSILRGCIEHLRASYMDALHPFLLPMIILTHEMSEISNAGQQCSREKLQNLEAKLGRPTIEGQARLRDLSDLEQQLLKFHKDIIEKHPQTQMEVVKVFERTLQESAALERNQDPAFLKKDQIMNGSLTFYRTKLEGISADVSITLARIEILRAAVQNKLAVALAEEQQILDNKKHDASMRYSKNQQTFSILGVLFLPGTFFAAIFSTSFFDFHPNDGAVVSNYFWLFWVLTIPTMVALVLFLFWHHLHPMFSSLMDWRTRCRVRVSKGEKSNV